MAAAIRSIIIEKRLYADGSTPQESKSQERVLDAAVPAEVRVNEPADVVALIRLPDSKGLRAVLQSDESYSVSPEDVKSSEAFEVRFPRDDCGKLLPTSVQFELQAPGFDPPKQSQQVRIMPKGDSPVCVFMLTPRREERLALVLNVVSDGELIASRRLVTTAASEFGSAEIEAPTPYKVIEMPLRTGPRSNRLSEETRSYGVPGRPALPDAAAIEPSQYCEIGRTAPLPAMPAPSAPAPQPLPGYSEAPVGTARKKSKLPWIGLGAAAAAAFLLSVPSVLIKTGGESRAPTSASRTAACSATPLNETIASLSRQIEQNPTNAELYVRRADAYKRANNLTAAGKDVDNALQLAPNHLAAIKLRTEIIQQQERRRAATHAISR